jgi:hypothetical protein
MKDPYIDSRLVTMSGHKALEALDKKFPFKDKRKKDLQDMDTILEACEDVDADDFEDLVDMAYAMGRLNKRMLDNSKLAHVARAAIDNAGLAMPNQQKFINIAVKETRVKRDKKLSEAEKTKKVADLLSQEINALTPGVLHWSTLERQSSDQHKVMFDITKKIKAAKKALKKKIYDAPKDAKHLKLAQKAWKDLVDLEKRVGKCKYCYSILGFTFKQNRKTLGDMLGHTIKSLVKLKAPNAYSFLQKMAA